jgi:acyl-CoA synthetase (AMP-forming)/AMP-acid ligase II
MAAVGNRGPMVPLVLAARALNLALVAVDAGTTDVEMREACERFGVAAVVTQPGEAAAVDGRRLQFPDALQLILRPGPHQTYLDTAVVKITSGSTGLPKATLNTERHLITDSRQIVTGMGIGPADTQIAVIPLSHAYGLSVILVPLILQGTAMVLRESFVPHRMPEDAETYGATTFPGVPFMFEHFLAHPPAGWPPRLRRLISAGARLPPETVSAFRDRFGLKIHSFYGASECGGISYDASDEVDIGSSVGHPLPGVTITFRPDEDTPPGAGRVHVASGGVACGYVGESSAEFFDGGFLTGDYGRFDDHGRLTLTGRVSSFINVAGKKVQPAEVEQVLRRMPGVADVRIMAAADPQRGEQVAACIALEPSHRGRMTPVDVRRFCSAQLAAFKIPRVVVFLDAIPLTGRGKTDRRALDAAIRAQIRGIPEQLC